MKSNAKRVIIVVILIAGVILPSFGVQPKQEKVARTTADLQDTTQSTEQSPEGDASEDLVETVNPVEDEQDRESSAIELVEKDNLQIYDTSSNIGYVCDFNEKIVSYISPCVYIYSAPNEESDKAGAMLPKNEATILQLGEEWTYVQFGNSTGYVKNEQVLFGVEALSIASEEGKDKLVLANNLTQIFATPTEDTDKKITLGAGHDVTVLSEEDGFVYICYGNERYGYVKSEDVKTTYELEQAMTIDEYNAYLEELAAAEALRKKQEEEARLKAEREAAVQAGLDKYIPTVQGESFNLSEEDIWLLACLVKYESGHEPYEGKLAVANVVLNRYKSAKSLSAVIYAKYQFSGVSDGNGGPSDYFKNNYLDKPLTYRLTAANAEECMKAAIEAASGINNISDYKYFRAVRIAEFSKYLEYKIIGNHIFYKLK